MIKPILQSGSKIILVNDPTPGDKDNGQHFSGTNGRVLKKALHLAGIDIADCSITGIEDTELLARELSSANPNVAVALGEGALTALTGEHGITKWRGSILPSILSDANASGVVPLKVVPSLHPDWIRRGQFQHFWSLVGDLTRVEAQSQFPDIRRPQWTSHLSPSLVIARDFLRAIPDDAPWCLDIETRAGHLACFSIASGSAAMCFPIQNPGGAFYFPSHEAALWREVQALMDRNPNLVGQNLTFDLEYLFDYGLEPSGIYMDTMLSHSILYPEFPKSLAFLVALYTEMPYYKDEGKVSNPKIDTKTLHEYNNKDTIGTLWCAETIAKELRKRGLWQVHEFVTQEIGLALEMQRNRLKVDPPKREELKQMVNDSQADLDVKWDSTMRKLAGGEAPKRPNVNSPKQVAEFLYGALNLKKKTWQGKTVSDEAALTELKAKHPEHPELGWILEERHLRKLNSSYLDIELEPDGTLGGGWCPCGTETGRWTSGKGPRGRGLNLQTVPKAVRWMIVPEQREAA